MVKSKWRLADIQPNPFRNIDRYPINRDKVEKLKGSITRTEFWDNLVARVGPDDKPQIGYGHHRMVALRELYPEDHFVNLIVKPLDDEAMLHVMADENMKEWASTVEVTVETVRAVRDFLISSPATKSGKAAKANNGEAIADFLGWPLRRIADALAILNAEESGEFEPEDSAGLTLEQASELRRSVAKIADPVVRKEAVSRVRHDLSKGTIGKRGIPEVVREVQLRAEPKQPKPILPHEIANQVAADIERFWSNGVQANGNTLSRREIVQLIAANRNAEGVRNYVGSIRRALTEMNKINQTLLDLLTAEAIEKVS